MNDMIEKQIKLALYDKYHDLDVIDNNNQSINCCWFAEDNILKIGIDAYNKKTIIAKALDFKLK
jgi:hypothetical protein